MWLVNEQRQRYKKISITVNGQWRKYTTFTDYFQRIVAEIHDVYRLLSTDNGGNTRRLPITFNGQWLKYTTFTDYFQRIVAEIHELYRNVPTNSGENTRQLPMTSYYIEGSIESWVLNWWIKRGIIILI